MDHCRGSAILSDAWQLIASASYGGETWVGCRAGVAVNRADSAIIDFTESAYDFSASDEQWLPTLLERGLPVLERGLGVAGYEYVRPNDDRPVELRNVHVASGPEDFAERHLRALSTTDPEVLKRQLCPGGAHTGSEDVRTRGTPEELEHYISCVDYCKDVLFITAVDPAGAGVAIVAPLAEVTTLSRPESQRWKMMAAHVTAGHRIRRRLATGNGDAESATDLPHDAEAIVDPKSFRVVEAVGRAEATTTKAALRDSAVLADRARGKLRNSDPNAALEIWQALVRGRWSMVDWFDTDGRRFVLAIPNAPEVNDPRGLTERESQVVTYAGFGDSNKMIAYRLGLSLPRVSLHLRNAMRKLGLRTRVQLVTRMRAFRSLH